MLLYVFYLFFINVHIGLSVLYFLRVVGE